MKFDPTLPADGINVTPTHPLSELALLLGGLVGAAVLTFVALGFAIDRLIVRVPPAWEARLFSGFGPDEDVEKDPRAVPAQMLLDRLVAHTEQTPFEFRVAVMDGEDPNALAFPGGLIVLTTGLLNDLGSENELALVLGHELGHYAGRDHLEGLGRGLALAFTLGIFGAGESGSAAGLAALAAQLAARGHDREQETLADAFGLALVHAEYGHVAGAGAFFERLPNPDGILEERLAHYLSTHPLNDERIAALHTLARTRGWSFDGDLVAYQHP